MQRRIILANGHTNFSANFATMRTKRVCQDRKKKTHYQLIEKQIRNVSLPSRGAWHDEAKWAESLKKKKKEGGLTDSASRPLLVCNVSIV